MVYLLDDFHVIQTVKVPGPNLKLSLAKHMASNMLDIQNTVPAIPLPIEKKQHRIVTVNVNGEDRNCRGAIDPDFIFQLVRDNQKQWESTFLGGLPEDLRKIKPNDIQAQLKEFRCSYMIMLL